MIRPELIATVIIGGDMVVLRVQDMVGRGPYRWGFSHQWTDPLHEMRNPSFMHEFPFVEQMLQRRPPAESAYGCAFRTLEQACRWFSEDERRKLAGLGYRLVAMKADDILEESDRQLVFWRRIPLHKNVCPVAAWEARELSQINGARRDE